MNGADDQSQRQPFGARSLCVAIVAHNDSANIDETLDRIIKALTITVEEFEIVVFADGSEDDTAAKVRRWQARRSTISLRENAKPLGLGHSLLQAAHETRASYVAYIPGDNSWPYRAFVELFGNLAKADIIASYSTNMFRLMTPTRRFASKSHTALLNFLFARDLHYYNGLAIYPTEYLRRATMGTYGMGFQAEALVKAITAGYTFLEVALPVDIRNAPKAQSFTVANTWDAVTTAARLFCELKILRRAPLPRESGPALREDPSASNVATPREATPLRIVVTGGSAGIGASIAAALASDQHQVFVCARRPERLAELAARLPSIMVHACDVSDEGQVKRFVEWLGTQTPAVDVLINCAGVVGAIGPFELTDTKAWWRAQEVNLLGVYLMIKHCLPLLERGKWPKIINFSGGGAFEAFPRFSAYACSKAATVRLTECLANEFQSKKISVNAVAPGMLATDLQRETVAAGAALAGPVQYRRALSILREGGPPVDSVVECIRAMISPALDGLTGKTVSANFDPWQTPAFQTHVAAISRSDLFSLRRVNVANLPDGQLRRALAQAWADFGIGN